MGSTRQLRQSDPVRGSLTEAIPGVDGAALAEGSATRAQAIDRLREACLSTGFFCLDNLLGRSPAYADVLQQMQHFFALPSGDAHKQAINVAAEENTHGWMPLYHEPAYQPGTVAHVESFDCGRESRGAHDRAYRPNRWPDINGFRDDVEALWRHLAAAGADVLRGVADGFELDSNFLLERCSTQDLNTMRLLNYPSVDPAQAGPRDVGIAAHTDFECITFIMQTAPGLELMDVNGNWFDAPAGPDRIVVLLGDMLERWTNGMLRATGHRVRHRDFQRFSIVLFFAVNTDVVVAPLDRFVSAENPARYDAMTQREHTRNELMRAESYRDELLRDSKT